MRQRIERAIMDAETADEDARVRELREEHRRLTEDWQNHVKRRQEEGK